MEHRLHRAGPTLLRARRWAGYGSNHNLTSTLRCYFEHRAIVVRAAHEGRAIEVALFVEDLFLGQQQVFPAFLRGSIFLTVLALLPLPLLIYWFLRVRFSKVYKNQLSSIPVPVTP